MSDDARAPAATPAPPLSMVGRIRLLARVWRTFATTAISVRRRGLEPTARSVRVDPAREPQPVSLLSRAVSRGLRIGPWQPRCLYRSLVLYALVNEQGGGAELVIGLPPNARTPDAHAWVEVDGRDVGPMPGSLHATEMVRYPPPRPTEAGGSLPEPHVEAR
jgi:hypothetical protein